MAIMDDEYLRRELINELEGYRRRIEWLKDEIRKEGEILKEINKKLAGNEKTFEDTKNYKHQGVLQLLQIQMPIGQIAKIFNVSEEFVESVKSKKIEISELNHI